MTNTMCTDKIDLVTRQTQHSGGIFRERGRHHRIGSIMDEKQRGGMVPGWHH
jgi:hypothetical protein